MESKMQPGRTNQLAEPLVDDSQVPPRRRTLRFITLAVVAATGIATIGYFCTQREEIEDIQVVEADDVSCRTLLGPDSGKSDGGEVEHEQVTADEQRACSQVNKQKTVYTSWVFKDSKGRNALDRAHNIFDIEQEIRFEKFSELQAYGVKQRGIYQALRFVIAPGSFRIGFSGYTGAQIAATGKGTPLQGTHLFSIWDTRKPGMDDRRLAIPAADPGNCQRNCNDCGLHADWNAADHTTGVQCKAPYDATIDTNAFRYRLRMSNSNAQSTYAGKAFTGTEWEVTVTDLNGDAEPQVIGRVLLENDAEGQGISSFKNFHEHIGCTPCDAYYESTTITGPYVNKPPGVSVSSGTVEPPAEFLPKSTDRYTCRKFRTTHEGGLTIRFETGPGVEPAANANTQKALIFDECKSTPAGGKGGKGGKDKKKNKKK